jgi:ABC-2 type transport system permease protein
MIDEAGAHFYKQIKIMSKRLGDLAWIFIYPLIGLISLGIFAYFVTTMGSPPETMLFVLIGVIVWDIYGVGERATSNAITLDIWSDCLRHTFTGTSSITGFIVGNGLFGLFSGAVVFVLLSTMGLILFGFNILHAGIFLTNLFFVFLFATSFGLIINSLMLTKGHKYMSLAWITPGLVMIFSGIYYPIDLLPYAIRVISLAIPSTHSLISLRASLGFSPELAVPEFFAGALLALAYFAGSVLLFKWAIRRSKVTGIIVKH